MKLEFPLLKPRYVAVCVDRNHNICNKSFEFRNSLDFRRVGIETVCSTTSALLPVLYCCWKEAATLISIPDTTQQL